MNTLDAVIFLPVACLAKLPGGSVLFYLACVAAFVTVQADGTGLSPQP